MSGIQPMLCVASDLDDMQVADLKTRFTRVAERIHAYRGKWTHASITNGIGMRDSHGGIDVHAMSDELVIRTDSFLGMGWSKFQMPIPAGLKPENHESRPIVDQGVEGITPMLDLWLQAIDAPKADQIDYLTIGHSGFSRMLAMVGCILRASKPTIQTPKVDFMMPFAYDAAQGMMGPGPSPYIGIRKGDRPNPILNAKVTETLLRLHPSLTLRSNGGRNYRITRMDHMRARIGTATTLDAMRWLGDLGIDPDKKVVLKAGMDLE